MKLPKVGVKLFTFSGMAVFWFFFFFNFLINNNNYITITEYIHYKTYNLQHNVETLTLLNSGFKTILTKYYLTLPTYSTPLTALEIPYLQNLA